MQKIISNTKQTQFVVGILSCRGYDCVDVRLKSLTKDDEIWLQTMTHRFFVSYDLTRRKEVGRLSSS